MSILKQIVIQEWPNEVNALEFRDQLFFLSGLIFNEQEIDGNNKKLYNNYFERYSLRLKKSLNSARSAVFWLRMSHHIQKFFRKCDVCQSTQNSNLKEPLELKDVPLLTPRNMIIR